jgi:hypothetical protein
MLATIRLVLKKAPVHDYVREDLTMAAMFASFALLTGYVATHIEEGRLLVFTLCLFLAAGAVGLLHEAVLSARGEYGDAP